MDLVRLDALKETKGKISGENGIVRLIFDTVQQCMEFYGTIRDAIPPNPVIFRVKSKGIFGDILYYDSIAGLKFVVTPFDQAYPVCSYYEYDEDRWVHRVRDARTKEDERKYEVRASKHHEMKGEILVHHSTPLWSLGEPRMYIDFYHDSFEVISACLEMKPLSEIKGMIKLVTRLDVLRGSFDEITDAFIECKENALNINEKVMTWDGIRFENGVFVAGCVESFDLTKTMILAHVETNSVTLSLDGKDHHEKQTFDIDAGFRKRFGCPPGFDMKVIINYDQDVAVDIKVKMKKM